jgi:hypothetical protein
VEITDRDSARTTPGASDGLRLSMAPQTPLRMSASECSRKAVVPLRTDEAKQPISAAHARQESEEKAVVHSVARSSEDPPGNRKASPARTRPR